MFQPARFASRRNGYTLTEIAVVLAIMTALATASWPMLMKPWQRSIIQRDASMLREAMQNARLTAISHGHAYQLRWKLGKNEFEIQSRDRVIPEIPRENETARASSIRSSQTRPAQFTGRSNDSLGQHETLGESTLPRLKHHVLLKERLTEGVVFDAELIVADDASEMNLLRGDSFELPGSESNKSLDDTDRHPAEPEFTGGQNPHSIHDRWSDPIVFHPNGRAENRDITLHSDDGYSITISLRGFTGTATVGRPVKTVKQEASEPEQFSRVNDDETQRTFAN